MPNFRGTFFALVAGIMGQDFMILINFMELYQSVSSNIILFLFTVLIYIPKTFIIYTIKGKIIGIIIITIGTHSSGQPKRKIIAITIAKIIYLFISRFNK